MNIIVLIVIIAIKFIIYICFVIFRCGDISCTRWWVAEDRKGDLMRWITEKLSTETPASWANMTSLHDKFVRFLYEFHDFRFSCLDLPPLPADRSDFDVHGAINNDQVWILVYLFASK